MANQRRATVTVHLEAIEHNYRYIRSKLSDGCKVCAMVKADAYGHGMVEVSQRLERCGVDYLGVADISEALEIRGAGVKTPILMMGYTAAEDMKLLGEYNLTQTVFSPEYAALLSSTVAGPVKCHLKLDTGMSRLGFFCPDGEPTHELLDSLSLPRLDFEGVFTHFSRSDEPECGKTERQFENYISVVNTLEKLGFDFKIRHCANSGAILNFPRMHLDMVRPGIMLYGLSPDGGSDAGLIPAMELSGCVELVKKLPAGATVSYGGRYTCARPTDVAVVSLGYADGVSRALAAEGQVCIDGRRTKILGSICMDHFMADVTDFGPIECGTPAYIFGGGGDAITADEVAAHEGTISYEVLCRMVGKRVTRRFVG